jgi:hypothetical protein
MARSYLLLMFLFVVMAVAGPGASAQEQPEPDAPPAALPDRPWETIDVAIALDTSGSMELLLETTRLKMWEMVNELTGLDPVPKLRVALLTFGNRANNRATGWVNVEVPFTEDLDLLGERLFELTSDGGKEYIGSVLETALNDLKWTSSSEALKLPFVAGNEPADQDPRVLLEDVSDLVQEKDVSLHLVFCGQPEEEAAKTWVRLAEWSKGRFAAIDHRTTPVSIKTPFDEELAGLGMAINETYVPLGAEGRERVKKLGEREEHLKQLSASTAASRAEVVSSQMYSSGWDLVDAFDAGTVDLYELDENELPEVMRRMTPNEREIYIQDIRSQREELRQRIGELSEQRRRYMAEQIETRGIDNSRAFDSVVRGAIREELEVKGFQAPGD